MSCGDLIGFDIPLKRPTKAALLAIVSPNMTPSSRNISKKYRFPNYSESANACRDDAPWRNNGDWNTYADRFAAAAGEIAAHYANLGDNVAYEIWNEGDNPDTPWVSVSVPPEDFAKVLGRSAAAVRQAAPETKIVLEACRLVQIGLHPMWLRFAISWAASCQLTASASIPTVAGP